MPRKTLIETTPKEEWRFKNGRLQCLAQNNTCPRYATEVGTCISHGGKSVSGKSHYNYKDGRYSKSFLDTNLREKYNSYLSDKRGNEIREAMAVLGVVIDTDISQLSNPAELAVTALEHFNNLNEAFAMRIPQESPCESQEQKQARLDKIKGQTAMIRAAMVGLGAALTGVSDDAKVRDRLAKNAARLARMSEQDASRQLKLNQSVNLDYVNALIIQVEQLIDEFIPQDRKHIFERQFEKLLEPNARVIPLPCSPTMEAD